MTAQPLPALTSGTRPPGTRPSTPSSSRRATARAPDEPSSPTAGCSGHSSPISARRRQGEARRRTGLGPRHRQVGPQQALNLNIRGRLLDPELDVELDRIDGERTCLEARVAALEAPHAEVVPQEAVTSLPRYERAWTRA